MKTRAVSMVLLMIASALAGCTSGDPDGDGEMGIDADLLDQLIQDNLQDFINNSSVTVHQTVHYHNNTTYVDNSESNMNIGNSGTQGNISSQASVIQVMRIEEIFDESLVDTGNIQFMSNGTSHFPSVGYNPTMTYMVNGQTISMDFTCEEVINAIDYMSQYDWEQWARYELNFDYYDAEQLGSDIADDLEQYEDDAFNYCSYQGGNSVWNTGEIFEMELSDGEVLSFTQLSQRHHNTFRWELSCDDDYHEDGTWYSVDNGEFIGGWTDCIFTGYHAWQVAGGWESLYFEEDNNSTSNQWGNNFYYPNNIPIWYYYSDYNRWKEWNIYGEETEFDGIFYFTKYFVVPVE